MEKEQSIIDHFINKRALLFSDDECGDTGMVELYDNACFFALIDALGHGATAFKIAQIAEEYLKSNYRDDLKSMMSGLHDCLKETRGAVAALCKIDTKSREFRFVGVGNIAARVMGSNSFRIVSSDGILGYTITRPKEQIFHLDKKDTVILHSDGISEHFNSEDFPSVSTMNAHEIGIDLMEQFGKENDDKSCVIIKFTE